MPARRFEQELGVCEQAAAADEDLLPLAEAFNLFGEVSRRSIAPVSETVAIAALTTARVGEVGLNRFGTGNTCRWRFLCNSAIFGSAVWRAHLQYVH